MGKNAAVSKDRFMLEETIGKLIISMAIPTILTQIASAFYNVTDTFFVSQLGTAATAAVGVNGSFDRIFGMVGTLLASGAGTYISRLLGEKDKDGASRVLSTSFLVALLSSFVFMAAGLLFTEPLVYLMGATNECANYSIDYATYIFLAAPFTIGTFLFNSTIRCEGNATIAMVGSITGTVINIGLDPVFIFALNMGVKGASLATAISKVISFAILISVYLRRKGVVRLSYKAVCFKWYDVKEVVKIGMASMIRNLLSILSAIVLNKIAGGFSTAALAAVSVVNRIMNFPFYVLLGFTLGGQPVIGYNWGAKRIDRVKQAIKFSYAVMMVFSIILSLIIALLGRPIITLFNSAADAEVMSIGLRNLRWECLGLPFHGLLSVMNMFYVGAGKGLGSFISNTARNGFVLIPVLVLSSTLFGVDGLVTAQGLTDVISFVVCIPLLINMFNILKKAEHPDEPPEEQIT